MSAGERPGAAILVVEDEAAQRALIAAILSRAGHAVSEAGSVDEALAHLATAVPDVILCDWRLPGRSGGELLVEVRARRLGAAFVVMTAYGSIAHAVDAVRLGADDYLAKPFEREALLLAIQRVVRTRRLEAENRSLREAASARDGLGEMIGRSPSMLRLFRTVEKVGASEATVLITGESGTGKELVARHLHRSSARAAAPFVPVNCAAIPATLIESELFGHEKGAFTGAHRRRPGRFEEAEGGTLFLDEIASMPVDLQGVLLRVVQERRYSRLGGSGEVACDVRVVAAANRDLPELVAAGRFREDLYYRLNVVPIELPPLRERREDIPLLATTFLARAASRHGVAAPTLPPAVLRHLVDHAWPGNVRELENTVERLVLLAEDGRIDVADLPAAVVRGASPAAAAFALPEHGLVWDELEASLLRQALERAHGNRTHAARLLGLSYKAFLYRLEKHGLDGLG